MPTPEQARLTLPSTKAGREDAELGRTLRLIEQAANRLPVYPIHDLYQVMPGSKTILDASGLHLASLSTGAAIRITDFRKYESWTDVRVAAQMSAQAASPPLDFRLHVSLLDKASGKAYGNLAEICRHHFSTGATHTQAFGGWRRLTGIPAGTYDVYLAWEAAGADATVNSQNALSMSVAEVIPVPTVRQ